MAGDQERVKGLARLERLVADLEASGWKTADPAALAHAAAVALAEDAEQPQTDAEAGTLAQDASGRPDDAASLELPSRITTELPKFLDEPEAPITVGELPDWQPANPSLARRALGALTGLRRRVGAAVPPIDVRRAAVVAAVAGAAGLAALGVSLERRPVSATEPQDHVLKRLSFMGTSAAFAIETAMTTHAAALAPPSPLSEAMADQAEETLKRLALRDVRLEEGAAAPVAAPPETPPVGVAAAAPSPEPMTAAAPTRTAEPVKAADPVRMSVPEKPTAPAKTAEARGPVLVRDLPAGSTLSVGTKLSDTAWLVEARELSELVVTLPSNAPDQFRATIAPLSGEAASHGTITLEVRRTARLEPSVSRDAEVSAPAELPQVPPAPTLTPAAPPPAVTAKTPPRAKDKAEPAAAGDAPKRSSKPKASNAAATAAVAAPPAVAPGARESANDSAPQRPKVVAPAAVQQPSAYVSSTGTKSAGKPKKPVPQATQKSAVPLVPPSALGAPPPPPPPGPGWLFRFLNPE